MCTIYKHGLLRTAHKHFGRDSTSWKLQEDNDPKHMSKLAKDWKEEKKSKELTDRQCFPTWLLLRTFGKA